MQVSLALWPVSGKPFPKFVSSPWSLLQRLIFLFTIMVFVDPGFNLVNGPDRLDDRIRCHGDGIYSFFHQELREVGEVGRTLSADTHFNFAFPRCFDQHAE